MVTCCTATHNEWQYNSDEVRRDELIAAFDVPNGSLSIRGMIHNWLLGVVRASPAAALPCRCLRQQKHRWVAALCEVHKALHISTRRWHQRTVDDDPLLCASLATKTDDAIPHLYTSDTAGPHNA